ncbi:MAG: hypothetical protein QF363_18265 [Planctomycetaceae bacterium]|jgi:hypothetical protein|nr:hypothetical protein [Planctomycetaceae bacterium]
MTNVITRCLGVLLLLVPVSAMVAMVVFGVPQITPLVVLPGWQKPAETGRNRPVDPSARATSGQALQKPERRENTTARLTLSRPLSATARRPRVGQLMASPRSLRKVSVTWNEVRTGLALVGVERFKIQPGGRGGEVHFSCVQSVPGQPRLSRRFEAEANDPVSAASDVLRQIQQSVASSPQIVGSR